MSAKQEPIDRLREFIMKQFPVARRRMIKDDDALLDSGIVDSMGVLEIGTFLESEFGMTLTDDDMASDNFQSIATLAVFVQSKSRGDIKGRTAHFSPTNAHAGAPPDG